MAEPDRDIMSSKYLKSIPRNNGMKFLEGNAGAILIAAPDLDYRASPKGQQTTLVSGRLKIDQTHHR